MPAQVGGDDVEPVGEPLLGQLAEAAAVAWTPWRQTTSGALGVAPLVDVCSLTGGVLASWGS